ncbi:MAG TPA: hypothetical protein VNT26_07595 [Candidatus Sulfotelmatobacter sp.]|nr:hypothetical protein [Candidatus Sulfotelmatobacter sp.]
MTWLKERWPALTAGLLLWVLLAAGATLYASQQGGDVWQQIVTWDEWAVALGLLVRFLIPIFRKSEVVDKRGRRVIGWLGDMTWALAVVFALDLLARAVLGLGWEPF